MYSHQTHNNLFESIYAGSPTTLYNLHEWFLKADFSRNNTDLISVFNGKKIILIDYFTNHELPSVQTENGLFLKGST